MFKIFWIMLAIAFALVLIECAIVFYQAYKYNKENNK